MFVGGQISSVTYLSCMTEVSLRIRMGASDRIHAGKSTFMVELQVRHDVTRAVRTSY